MNHLLSEGRLLDEKGALVEAGYATSLVKIYNRSDIVGALLRIKEWDYYYIGNESYGLALTIADNSYMSLASVSVLDFTNKKYVSKSVMGFMPCGKLHLPYTSEVGDVKFENKKLNIQFLNDGDKRHLLCTMNNFDGNRLFTCDIELTETMSESMVIATPFNKKRHFYYNQKINCLKAKGYFQVGSKVYPVDDAYGVLDWGRGVWTYKNTWYWSSMSGVQDDEPIGFNLGYGFGDTSAASENMLFYKGKAHKLNDVKFNIPLDEKGHEDYLKPWTFTSKSGDIHLDFKPIIDRYSGDNVVVIKSIQHQVFGVFSGYFKVNNELVEINNLVGFAEKVTNNW